MSRSSPCKTCSEETFPSGTCTKKHFYYQSCDVDRNASPDHEVEWGGRVNETDTYIEYANGILVIKCPVPQVVDRSA